MVCEMGHAKHMATAIWPFRGQSAAELWPGCLRTNCLTDILFPFCSRYASVATVGICDVIMITVCGDTHLWFKYCWNVFGISLSKSYVERLWLYCVFMNINIDICIYIKQAIFKHHNSVERNIWSQILHKNIKQFLISYIMYNLTWLSRI